MSFTVVIPARYQSSRLPGKPLLDIAGKPMLQHVYEAACKSDAKQVLIATDHEKVIEVAQAFGASVFMTSVNHPSGTDRLQEVARLAELAEDDLIVNVQGDEPLIDPALINQVAVNLLANEWASIASLCERIHELDTLFNANNVKVVFSIKGEALYFSRAPIPWNRDAFVLSKQETPPGDQTQHFDFGSNQALSEAYYRHIGIYAYRVAFLDEFVKWPPASLEQLESLEQLRAMENGHRIHIEPSCTKFSPGVDTQEDLELVRKIFQDQN